MEWLIILINLLFFQVTGGEHSILETILLIATALGLREAVGYLLTWRKTNVETTAIERKTKIEERLQSETEYDKSIQRYNDLLDKTMEFSKQIFEIRTHNNNLHSELNEANKKIGQIEQEKEHLNASLKTAGENLNLKDITIMELRGKLQDKKL